MRFTLIIAGAAFRAVECGKSSYSKDEAMLARKRQSKALARSKTDAKSRLKVVIEVEEKGRERCCCCCVYHCLHSAKNSLGSNRATIYLNLGSS